MRYVKFWLVGDDNIGSLTAVRAWCEELETRFEITKREDNGEWEVLAVVTHTTDHSWGFQQLFSDKELFSVMAALERHCHIAVDDVSLIRE